MKGAAEHLARVKPRARRQVAEPDLRRRRPRGGGQRRRRRDLRRHRPDLHGGLAPHGPGRGPRRGRRAPRRPRARDPPRRPARPRHRDGPGRLPRATSTRSSAGSRRRATDGARLVTGGARPEAPELRDGFFVEPTIFGDVDNGMAIAREEVFGPVLAALRFSDEEEAVRLANDTPFGLAAGRVDARRPARAPDGERDPGRDGVDQRLPQRRPDGPVRRLQGERAWGARTVSRRSRVHARRRRSGSS